MLFFFCIVSLTLGERNRNEGISEHIVDTNQARDTDGDCPHWLACKKNLMMPTCFKKKKKTSDGFYRDELAWITWIAVTIKRHTHPHILQYPWGTNVALLRNIFNPTGRLHGQSKVCRGLVTPVMFAAPGNPARNALHPIMSINQPLLRLEENVCLDCDNWQDKLWLSCVYLLAPPGT